MHTFRLTLIVTAIFLFGCSTSPQQQGQQAGQTPGNYRATWKSVPELQDVMDAMVEMGAETLWNAALDEHAPKTGEDWEKLDHAAITLIHAGKYIKTSHLALNNPDWPQDSDKFIAVAEAARKAVKDKDLKTLVSTGDELNEVCANCHNKYFEDQ